jgi:gamma-glutamyl phosphate reductase
VCLGNCEHNEADLAGAHEADLGEEVLDQLEVYSLRINATADVSDLAVAGYVPE